MDLINIDSFFSAIEEGDFELVKNVILKGFDVNIGLPEDDLKPLHMAVKSNQLEICKLLIEHGAEINLKDQYDGWTAMHWATQPDVDSAILLYLLKHGGDPNSETFAKRTPLHEVMFKYNPTKLFHLFNAGVEKSLNIQDTMFKETPLFCAVRFLHSDACHLSNDIALPCAIVVKELIRRGSDVNLTNAKSENILHKAMAISCYEVTDMLINQKCSVNALDKDGDTPVHKLIAYYCQDVKANMGHVIFNSCFTNASSDLLERHLVNAVMDQNKHSVPDGEECKDTWQEYEKSVFEKNLSLFLSFDVNINLGSRNGNTPFHVASMALKPMIHLKELLLSYGADINAKNNQRKTPLHLTCQNTQYSTDVFNVSNEKEVEQTLNLFISNGSNIDSEDACKLTPLDYALMVENKQICDLLLKAGATVTRSDICGVSPLHNAAQATCPDLIDLVISYGGNIESKDMYGAPPLFYAVYQENKAVAKHLLELGADVNLVDQFNYTVWDIAKYFEDDSMLRLLNSFDNSELHEGKLKIENAVTNEVSIDQEDEENMSDDYSEDGVATVKLGLEEVDGWLADKKWKDDMEQKIEDFLSKPPILESQEYVLMKEKIVLFMKRVSLAVAELDERLKFIPVISGSVSEGTKVTAPDEYDILLSFTSFSGKVDIIEGGTTPAGYCNVMLKNTYLEDPIAAFFSKSRYLSSEKLSPVLYSGICKVLSNTDLWKDLGFVWDFGPYDAASKISTVHLKWFGPIFKGLPVSVDLVPAINMPGWWPYDMNEDLSFITSKMKDKSGCMIVLKPKDSVYSTQVNQTLRVSFSKLESLIFQVQPDFIRKGYTLAKYIREYCPCLYMFEDRMINCSIDNSFSTYNLKTVLFNLLKEGKILSPARLPQKNRVRYVAYKIWMGVLEAAEKGIMKSFFVHEHKVYDVIEEDHEWKMGLAFSKIITNILELN